MATSTEAQRLRAARVLADLTVEQLAGEINLKGFGAKTIGAVERGERQLRAHEIPIVAKATGVPEWFLTDGFAPRTEEPGVLERLETLEHQMRTMFGLSRGRIAADLAAAARQQELDADREDESDTGRRDPPAGGDDR